MKVVDEIPRNAMGKSKFVPSIPFLWCIWGENCTLEC